jgi:N-acetylneuraminic acid mutarotase
MPVAVTHGGVAVDGTTVWIVGGLLGDYRGGENLPTRDTWRYDTLTDTWAPGPRLPAATGAGGTAILGRGLHYFGGFAPDGQGDSSKHYVLNLDAAAFDPATTWTTAAPMPTARNHFGSAVLGGKIYAIGGQHGRDETNRNLRDVDVYDASTNRWSPVAKLPKPMSHFHNSTVVVNNRILIAGGVTNGRYPLTDTWEYDPATNQWAASLPLPAPRKAPVAVVGVGVLYVLTGSPGDNFPQSDVWYRGIG